MKQPKLSLTLAEYGNGWSFSVTYVDEFTDELRFVSYRTNTEGHGLWRYHGHEPKQILGTCQFSLPRTRSAAYAKIRHWAMRQFYPVEK